LFTAASITAIQTILRREGFPKPYEAVKDLTRVSSGKIITKDDFEKFISRLEVDDKIKDELRKITPETFIGVLPESSS